MSAEWARLPLWGPLLLVVAALAIVAHARGVWQLPARWNPWAPLTLDEADGPFTRWKLARLADDGGACRAVLSQAGWRTAVLPDRSPDDDCGWRDALQVQSLQGVQVQPFTLTCPTAVALARWERQVLQPAAQAHFGQPVRRLEHFGSFACRNVYGREEGRRSRHATANAFDIAGVVLADGRRVTVARDWGDEGAAGRFLRALRDGACRQFDVVLGPEYNAAHADHLHVDRGGGRVCR